MKHKYRNYYFPVLICIVFCLCIFLVRHAFSVRTQTNASLPVTEVRQSFSFWIPLILNFQSCATEIWIILPFPGTGKQNEHPYWLDHFFIQSADSKPFWANSDSVPDLIGAGNFSSIYGNISADDAIAQGTSVIWRNWFQNMHRITIRSFSKRT